MVVVVVVVEMLLLLLTGAAKFGLVVRCGGTPYC